MSLARIRASLFPEAYRKAAAFKLKEQYRKDIAVGDAGIPEKIEQSLTAGQKETYAKLLETMNQHTILLKGMGVHSGESNLQRVMKNAARVGLQVPKTYGG